MRYNETVMRIGAMNAGFVNAQDNKSSGLRLSTFDIDATPPVGSRLAYDPMVNSWDMGLRAKGIVLHGAGNPIVLMAIEWISIDGESQDAFKSAFARAAGTTPERVAVHTSHQHDAPTCNFRAERILKDAGLNPMAYESSYQHEVIQRLASAVEKSLKIKIPVR